MRKSAISLILKLCKRTFPAHIILYLTIVLMCFGSSSCKSHFEYARIVPPDYDNLIYDSVLQYVSLYDVTKLDFSNKKRIEVHASGIKNIKEGIFQSLPAKYNYKLFAFDSAFKGNALNDLAEPLNPDSVGYFCSFNQSPLLITLEAYDIFYNKESKSVENDEGETERKVDYYLVVKAGISLYDSSGFLIDRSEMKMEEYITTKNVVALGAAFRPSYSSKQKQVDRMSTQIGQNYIAKYFPTERIESRMFYKKKYFAEITPYIESGEWEKAIELLLPLTDTTDQKIAKRATHNLGVLYEAIGDAEKSEYWLEKSKTYNNSKIQFFGK